MTDPPRARWWDLLALAAFVAAVFAAGLTPIADGDIFWHLAAGRQMTATHRLLHADPFSVSAFGRPWIDVHWLFQLGSYAVFRAGGYRGLVLVKAALTAGGALVLMALVEHEGGRRLRLPFAVALAAALFLARHLLLVRPVILTLVFLAVFLFVLCAYQRDGRPRPLLLLPALQVVWVNCQGLAPLGLGLMGAFLIAALVHRRSRWRPLAGALVLAAAASFVSPYGAAGALLPLRLLLRITPAGANVFAHEVAENVPPFILARTAPGQIAALPWYLVALALCLALAGRRLRLGRVLVIAAFVVLALMANRNILLLYWVATPLALLEAAPAVARWSSRLPRAQAAAGLGALLALDGVAALAAAREPSLAAPTPFRFPTESAALLAARPGGGPLFAADHQGDYLIWTLAPRYRPYLDTRLILRTAAEFAEYLDLVDHPEHFDAFQERQRFAYAVLPTGYPDRYLPLVRHLADSPDWKLLFTDGAEALFAYRSANPAVDLADATTTDRLAAELAQRYARSPVLLAAARRSLARLDLVLGHADQAVRLLAPMPDPAARALLARCRFATGDLPGAESLARALLADDPQDVGSLDLLALIAVARGDRPAALEHLRRALAIDPFDAEAHALLDRLGGASR